eukprot:TRINITY_DN15152_c1_g2_i1.p1 TRINITY_DN15152_c1_g2~~TRINITY_DN15152_c1_g2_i1.p1  ORF type:complete len:310 (+),score=128.58 TRINITY_DN15152_c1_g2_i1:61-990(+)
MVGFDTCTFAGIIGWAVIARVAFDVASGFYARFVRPEKDMKKYGSWALVTGATDGIGKAYAFALAKRGLNVVIISRTESKLQDMKKELEEKYPSCQVMYVAADMGRITDEVKQRIEKVVNGIDLGVLINNVGVSYPYPQYYHELTDEQAQSLVDLNVTATNVMTRIALPKMLSNKRGAVVNISSFAGQLCNPLLAGYNGAKSGITCMTESLAAEYASKGIHFQAQTPLFVATKLAKQRKSFTVPEPAEYVAAAMKAIGYETVTSPFWLHAAISYVVCSLPTVIANQQIMGMHLGLRKRGQAKDAAKREN